MSVKSVDDKMGPEGVCPALLVYRTIPRPARKIPSESQLTRARAIDRAMKLVKKEQAKRRTAFRLRKYNKSPKGKEHSQKLRSFPAGSDVRVYRDTTKKWEGPFKFIEISGETALVQTACGRKIFCSTAVKPVTESLFDENVEPSIENNLCIGKNSQVIDKLFQCEEDESKSFVTKVIQNNAKIDFSGSSQEEISELMKRGTFKMIPITDVQKGERIFGMRFVDAIKTVDGISKKNRDQSLRISKMKERCLYLPNLQQLQELDFELPLQFLQCFRATNHI